MRASCRGWSSFRPGNASAVGKQRGLGESTKFLAVHKGFQDILLHFQIAVDDAVKPHSQFGKILHRLADAVIGRDIVRSEEHTSELQSLRHLVCRLLLEKKNSSSIKLSL